MIKKSSIELWSLKKVCDNGYKLIVFHKQKLISKYFKLTHLKQCRCYSFLIYLLIYIIYCENSN